MIDVYDGGRAAPAVVTPWGFDGVGPSTPKVGGAIFKTP